MPVISSPPKKKTKRVQHSRAIANPETRRLIEALRTEWLSLSKVQVGEELQHLRALGCTLGGLASDLGRSKANIRFHLDIAALPTEKKSRIENGSSAKNEVAYAAAVKREKRRQSQLMEEQTSGAVSARAAEIMLFAIKNDPNLKAMENDKLIIELHGRMSPQGSARRPFVRVPASAKDFEKIIRYCTPRPSERFWFEDLLRRLANIAFSQTPSEKIAFRALEVLHRLLRNYVEIQPKRDWIAMFIESRHVKTLDIPRRPHHRKQAHLIKDTGPWTRQSLSLDDDD